MTHVAWQVREQLLSSAWIRRMFEEAANLRALRGLEHVFDFSLGNPTEDPPAEILAVMERLAGEHPGGIHGYMPNAGFLDVRSRLAARLARQSGLPFTPGDVLMTAGASAACNVILKAILDKDDEVILLRPYFPDYPHYVANQGGRSVEVETGDGFLPDIDCIAAAVSARTRAIIINSPNNPTGRIYPAELLGALDRLLVSLGRPVLVISDEPYRDILYDGRDFPEVLSHVTSTVVCYSWSKSQALAGERIGFLALSPRIPKRSELADACVFAQRTLGYVNASALWQRVAGALPEVTIDVQAYQRKRDRLCGALSQIGYQVIVPEGGLYVFVRTPIADDMEYCRRLTEYGILAVPGKGFAQPGYMRLALTANLAAIEGAIAGFEAAFRAASKITTSQHQRG